MILSETELENNFTIDLGEVQTDEPTEEQTQKVPEASTFVGFISVVLGLLLNRISRKNLGKIWGRFDSYHLIYQQYFSIIDDENLWLKALAKITVNCSSHKLVFYCIVDG
ncbi:MAG: hypothetical protein QNJ68_17930 [Microcoleaceae cyanobacterium MO_207.B10]|nr:hypothetical protein [Microcoleaceae cyanobacterium MO_207.B10]